MFIWRSNILCTFILRHFLKRYTKYTFFCKNLFFLIVCFFFIYFGNFDIFSHMLISAIRAFWFILDVLTFAKFVEFLKKKGETVILFSSPKIYLINVKIWMNLNQYMLDLIFQEVWWEPKSISIYITMFSVL